MMDRYTVNKAVIQNVPVDELEKLYYIFDELACTVDYSRKHGELIISIGNSFELELTADPQELVEIQSDKYWQDDAMNVAEGYWKQ